MVVGSVVEIERGLFSCYLMRVVTTAFQRQNAMVTNLDT